ncbi:non-canonical purine NTP pyrophosphatase [Paraglaciecola hydrolytica]|uniref:dITP/XTP pyrophosphatase n=2 Tax=Paraglaciecola hydrolytica TaxID=1799789 RepID=A0A148KL79_9ALTE|nr:non-canonical purine NTP pyrophosphatase [Paraglaciecola hydrolytica]
MQKVVLATGNKGKVKELSAMLSELKIAVVPQSDFYVSEVAETGSTFVENAIIKARHAARITGLPAMADDSGLAVDALGGAPGVFSARYAGEDATDADNVQKLLEALNGVAPELRQARFLCVLVYMAHADDPTPIICQGEWQGSITTQTMGTNGFGYDPIFWVPEQNCSSAQLSPEQKNQLSHRGKALALMVKALAARLV